MAAFCEEFTLCGLLSGGHGRQQDGLQGVEEAGERDTVLLTDAGRTITLYKVSDQKPLGSWAVKQNQRVTCPAVYNHRTGEYVLVHDDKVLRVWKDEDVNLDKVFKATLLADVCRVHSLPDAEPLVLFRGGAVRTLDTLLAEPQQEIETVLSEGETIVWSHMFIKDARHILIYITERSQGHSVHVWRSAVHQTYRLQPFTEDARKLDFTAAVSSKTLSLMVLYSSGHVCLSQVPLVQSGEAAESVLTASVVLQLPEPVEAGALMVLDDSYIATLAPSSEKQKDRLCIWNTSLQTLQDCKEFPLRTHAQLWSYNNNLYIPHGNALLVLRYVCEPSCLASALGKGRTMGKPESVQIVNWEILTGHVAQPKQKGSKRELRRSKKPDPCDNSSPLQALLPQVPTVAEKQVLSLVQNVVSHQELPDFQVAASNIIQGLVNRCKSDPKFYPQSSFIKLINTKKLSYSLCPDLVTLCLEKQDVRVLQLCLQQFIDVPEAAVCLCLKTFLSVGEDILQDVELDTKLAESYIRISEPATAVQNGFSPSLAEEDSCDVQMSDKTNQRPALPGSPVSLKRAVLLNSVLTSMYSEASLLPHLKDLSSDHVIVFLSYLTYLYKKCTDDVALNLPGAEQLSVTQILDWMNLLLDAHFTMLVMMPKAKPVLRTLQKFVKLQMKFYLELNKIEGSFSELQRLRKPARASARYSIEVLELY